MTEFKPTEPPGPAPWLDIMAARVGIAERPGLAANNTDILKCFAACGHPEIAHDETAWCAAEVGHALATSVPPLPTPLTAINLMARSYLNYGRPLDGPCRGAIAVWPRGAPPAGHVNVVEEVHGDGTITCVDGNVGDKVSRTRRKSADALAYRWPVAATKKDLKAAGSSEIKAIDVLRGVANGGALVTAGTAVYNTATEAAPVVATVGEVIKDANDNIGLLTTFVASLNKLGDVVIANPWMVPVGGVCGGLYLVLRFWESNRLARAERGDPLSSEV